MKLKSSITAALCMILCAQALAQAQDMEKELSSLAEQIATLVKEEHIKKITVLDFTDLQGNTRELGRHIAEQLTVNMVLEKRDFSVVDRVHLNRILAEHKLTASGLVDPENAKQLGKFAGVDAFVFGTVMPTDQDMSLTAKIISTETAEVVRGAKGKFKRDKTVDDLWTRATTGGNLTDDPVKVARTFGDLRVELRTLHVLNVQNLNLTMTLANLNAKKSIWVAFDGRSTQNFRLTDSTGSEFRMDSASGIPVTVNPPVSYGSDPPEFSPAKEIQPGESLPITIKFAPIYPRRATLGIYNIQLEFLVGHDFDTAAAKRTSHNLVTKIDAD